MNIYIYIYIYIYIIAWKILENTIYWNLNEISLKIEYTTFFFPIFSYKISFLIC